MLPKLEGRQLPCKLSKSEFFCTIKMLWLKILPRNMRKKWHRKNVIESCEPRKTLSNWDKHVKLGPVFLVSRSSCQKLCRLSNILRNLVIACLQLLGTLLPCSSMVTSPAAMFHNLECPQHVCHPMWSAPSACVKKNLYCLQQVCHHGSSI